MFINIHDITSISLTKPKKLYDELWMIELVIISDNGKDIITLLADKARDLKITEHEEPALLPLENTTDEKIDGAARAFDSVNHPQNMAEMISADLTHYSEERAIKEAFAARQEREAEMRYREAHVNNEEQCYNKQYNNGANK